MSAATSYVNFDKDRLRSDVGGISESAGVSALEVEKQIRDFHQRRQSALRDIAQQSEPLDLQLDSMNDFANPLFSSTALNDSQIAKAKRQSAYRSEVLAEWDGYVTSIGPHYFTAALKGIRGEGVEAEDEEAEIPVSDVAASDLDLLQLGGIFRLCVRQVEFPNGQPGRFSQVVFRRLPAYRQETICSAEERAGARFERLRVE